MRALPSSRSLSASLATLAALATLAIAPGVHAEGFDDGWAPPASAQERYGDPFNGSFVAIGARFGLTELGTSDFSGRTFDVGLRASFPMYVGDLRLAYRNDAMENTGAGAHGALDAHSLGVSLALHPLYLALLGSDWISYVVASLYVDLGGGLQITRLTQVGEDGEDRSERDGSLFWHWGVGVDLPLWKADAGTAPWLNVLYRQHRSTHDRLGAPDIGMPAHTVFVGLGWRINGLLF